MPESGLTDNQDNRGCALNVYDPLDEVSVTVTGGGVTPADRSNEMSFGNTVTAGPLAAVIRAAVPLVLPTEAEIHAFLFGAPSASNRTLPLKPAMVTPFVSVPPKSEPASCAVNQPPVSSADPN